MSGPVVELAIFPSSEALRADRSIFNKVYEIVTESAGSQYFFTGLQAEDKTTFYVAVGWETLAHHQALIDNKPVYDVLLSSIKPAVGDGNLSLVHAAFEDPAAALQALSAPATELAFFTLKSPDQAAVLPGSMKNLLEVLGSTKGKQGYTWGKVVEKEGVYALIIGWDSVDIHWDQVKNYGPLTAAVHKVFESVTSDLVHIHFTKYTV